MRISFFCVETSLVAFFIVQHNLGKMKHSFFMAQYVRTDAKFCIHSKNRKDSSFCDLIVTTKGTDKRNHGKKIFPL